MNPWKKPLPQDVSGAVAEGFTLVAEELDALRDSQQNGNLRLLQEFGELRASVDRLTEAQKETNRALGLIFAKLEEWQEGQAAWREGIEKRFRKMESNGHAHAE